MTNWKSVAIILGLIVLGSGCAYFIMRLLSDPIVETPFQTPAENVFLFSNLRGPNGKSIVPPKKTASWKSYAQGSKSRLAVFLTDEHSQWLGLAHGLKSIGIPFLITTDYKEAVQHHVVLVYPSIVGGQLKPEALKALAALPRDGGTLIATQVLGGGLNETFGFKEAIGKEHDAFDLKTDSALTKRFSDPKEKHIRLERNIESYGYAIPARTPLAVYEEGTAAITQKDFQKGHAYAFGFDIGHYVLKGYNNRQEGLSRSYDNQYEPSIDVILRLLEAMYRQGEPRAVTLGTVPDGKELSVLITHDVDFTKSIKHAVDYAKYENENNVPSTYFIQTKYIKDFNDDVFFNQEGVQYLKQISALGMELGSHTIAHSKVFSHFPMGTGQEQYPDYLPFVKDRTHAYNASILGELRISKFLLEHFSGKPLVSFRPGELSYPFRLPEALQATGYQYSSNTTANNSLTHLPYQLNYSRETDAETPIFEFPVTVEDEAPPQMGNRVGPAVALAEKLRQYGGCFVVLIHPNILGHKLFFEKEFVRSVKTFSWFGTVRQYGDWWASRNAVGIDVTDGTIRIVSEKAIRNMVLYVPKQWQLQEKAVKTIGITGDRKKIMLDIPSGHSQWRYEERSIQP